MVDDIVRTNPIPPQGSILLAENDALASAMGKAEYLGRVRGMGLGPLPIRPTSRSSASSVSRLSHEAAFNAQRNEMMTKWEEEKRRMAEQWRKERRRLDEWWEEEWRRIDERIATQSKMMEKMQKMIEDLATANATLVANTLVTLDTESPNILRWDPQ
jgi:biotin-(acetyl-CoA carboxylase) ligase